ncbi:MAG: hypothetical protein ABSF37_08705 [Sedimentisphaerales bacterium]
MNKTLDKFKERIMNFVYIFAPSLYHASQRTKVIFAICTVTAVITPIIFMAKSCSHGDARPTGYAIHAGPLSRKDKDGNKWVIELLDGQPRLFYSSNKLKLGPPLVVSTSVEFKGPDAFIGLAVKGQAGEKYSGGALKNGKQVEAPKFDIVDERGKLLARGQFKYG